MSVLSSGGEERAASSVLPSSAPIDLSILVPCYNEAESLPILMKEIAATLEPLSHIRWETLFVDDGSRDGTDRVIESLAAADRRVRGVSLRRNFGKSAALATGFRFVRGALVVTMDADLQDDPTELPRLLETLESGGYDLVSGWKLNRQDPITKTLPSRLFNAVTSAVSGIQLHDFNCGFKVYRREVTEAIEVYGELHRFMPALAHWRGFRVGELPVHHRARRFGRSKFGASRFVNGFLDLMSAAFISTSALKPLHVFGRVGLAFLAIGAAIGVYFIALWIGGEPIHVRPLMLFGAGLGLVGIQFILMGLLGEMIANLGARAEYPVKRRYNVDGGA